MQIHTFRLKPGQDLYRSIKEFVKAHDIQAGCVLSSVGSLTHARLRLANDDAYTDYEGHFEILALNGTVSLHGCHLHLAIGDGRGHTYGGHLGEGCLIYTTAEIVLAAFPGVVYKREPCAESGYDELAVRPAG